VTRGAAFAAAGVALVVHVRAAAAQSGEPTPVAPPVAAPPAPGPPVAAPPPEAPPPAPAPAVALRALPAPAPAPASAPMLTPAETGPLAPRISGFLQVFYRYAFETGSDGRVDAANFRVQRARVAIEGDVTRWLSYDLSIDPRAPTIRGILRDAYLTIKKVIPKHRIRIGQQKTQFGYENLVSSKRLYAVNRTEVSDNLSRGLNLRDIGISVIGRWPLGHGVRIEDAFSVVNGAGLNVQADDTRRKSYWGRVGVRYRDKAWPLVARLGVSGGMGDFIDPGDVVDDPADDMLVEFERVGVDVQIDHAWVFASAEYVATRDVEHPTGLPEDEVDEAGYYVNLVGKTPYRAGPILRYDVLGDEHQRWTFGAYYGLPDDRVRVMVNYEYRRLMDVVRGDDKLYLWTQVRF
jgi:hypothetical protein